MPAIRTNQTDRYLGHECMQMLALSTQLAFMHRALLRVHLLGGISALNIAEPLRLRDTHCPLAEHAYHCAELPALRKLDKATKKACKEAVGRVSMGLATKHDRKHEDRTTQ